MLNQEELVQLDQLVLRADVKGREAEDVIKLRRRIAQEFAALNPKPKEVTTVKEETDDHSGPGVGDSAEPKPSK